MTVLVIAEHDNKHLKAATLNTITAARQMNEQVVVLVAGYSCQAVAEQVAKIEGVSKVLIADAQVYEHQLAENLAELIASLAAEFSHIVAPATTFGKNLLPRLAALLDVAQISDITEVVTADTFVRPIYAGNAFATVRSTDKIKVITVRGTAFSPAALAENSAPIAKLSTVIENTKSKFLSAKLSVSSRPELGTARVIISGGRGMQNKENFQLLEKIANRLNAAIGASRAAVDAGFVANDFQVGQTGKVVAPELYIAVGISGAIQHLAGMKDSKVIVAINKDADAPIFQVADYGLVGDLFEILPRLDEALAKAGFGDSH